MYRCIDTFLLILQMKRQGIIQRNQLNYTLQSIPTMNYNDEYSS